MKQIPTATKRTSGICRRTTPRRRPPHLLPNQFLGIDGAEYSQDELEFMRALDKYKTDNRRPYPTCCEVLEVLRSLGYQKQAAADDAGHANGDGHPSPVAGSDGV